MSAARIALHLVAFQATWFGAVGGAAAGRAWIGPLAALAFVAWSVAAAALPVRELGVIALVGALGTAWETVPAALRLIEYRGGAAVLGGAPLWMAALWFAFAATLNVSLRWLRGRHWVAFGLGAVVGPLCFLAGEALGALRLVEPRPALLAQGAAWGVLLPVAVALAARFDGRGLERSHV